MPRIETYRLSYFSERIGFSSAGIASSVVSHEPRHRLVFSSLLQRVAVLNNISL